MEIKVHRLVALACLIVGMSTTSVAQFPGPQERIGALSWDDSQVGGGNPGPYDQDDLRQYKNTCGDDPNEYLIREHVGNSDEFAPDETENHRWVCADRPTDCAFNGKIYSQGQAVDLGSEKEEKVEGGGRGEGIGELEVCLDDDPSVPGGEWYDLDDDRLSTRDGPENSLSPEQVRNLTRVHSARPVLDRLWDENPGTDRTGSPSNNDETGAFRGYATEDDCDEDLQACDDNGPGFSRDPWFSAGAFTEGSEQDNNPSSNSYGGLHNRLQDSSDQFEPDAGTIEYLKDAYSDGPNADFKDNTLDSTPGPDNWGLSDTLTDSVSNSGTSLSAGQCHYRNGDDRRTSLDDSGVDKTQKYFGNSYANVTDRDGDGTDEGVWADPDNLSSSKTTFSCDLTRDRGIGYDQPGSNTYREEDKVYVGNIKFQGGDDSPARGLEHPVCGDDESEYFIETVGSPEFSGTGDGPYACTNSFDFCVEPTNSGPSLFETDEYTNVDEPREEEARFKQDSEVCLNPDGGVTGDTLHGVWYDQDLGDVNGDGVQDTCRTNALYGEPGVRWFDADYVEDYPYTVTGGIDDDYNKFLDEDRGLDIRDSNASLDGSDDPFNPSVESPVESGTERDELVTLGFCGGDDGSEYIASQICRTDICVSNRSHLGVAKESGSCVYDGRDIYSDVPQPVDDDKKKRTLYNSGENITLDYPQEQTITCVDGQWFEEGPIVFDRNEKNVSLGGEASASFRVVNLGTLDTEYEVTLNKDTEAEQFSTVEDKASNTFSVTVPPKQSKRFTLNIRGRSEIPDSADTPGDDITVTADAVNARTQGSDTLEVNLVDPGQTGSRRQEEQEQDRNIPGITVVEVLLLLMLSTAVYTHI